MADTDDVSPAPAALIVRAGEPADRVWVIETARARLGSERQASLERGLFEVTDFPILIAEGRRGRAGFLAWDADSDVCETVAIACADVGVGAGRALMEAVAQVAGERSCRVLKVVTTDDNVSARGFYEHLGYDVAGVRLGAVDETRRRFKPEIPPSAHDEIEYRRLV